MAQARICDNCKNIIDDVIIKLKGYKVVVKGKYKGYEIEDANDFCSFTCLAEYANKQQNLLEENLKIINKANKED